MENGQNLWYAQGLVEWSYRSDGIYLYGEHSRSQVIVIMNRRIRFRTYGGVRGRESKRLPPTQLLLPELGKIQEIIFETSHNALRSRFLEVHECGLLENVKKEHTRDLLYPQLLDKA